MGVWLKNGEAAVGDVFAVEVWGGGWDADIGIGWVTVAGGRLGGEWVIECCCWGDEQAAG